MLGVNYLIPQDKNRQIRINNLIDYCFEVAIRSGEIYLSDDNKAAALLLNPEFSLNLFSKVKLDIILILKALGVKNIFKALRRDALLKRKRPKKDISYLWFIGVVPQYQGQGIGKILLNEIIDYAVKSSKPLYLECSPENLKWYKKMGFEIYDELAEPPFQYFMRLKQSTEQFYCR